MLLEQRWILAALLRYKEAAAASYFSHLFVKFALNEDDKHDVMKPN